MPRATVGIRAPAETKKAHGVRRQGIFRMHRAGGRGAPSIPADRGAVESGRRRGTREILGIGCGPRDRKWPGKRIAAADEPAARRDGHGPRVNRINPGPPDAIPDLLDQVSSPQ